MFADRIMPPVHARMAADQSRRIGGRTAYTGMRPGTRPGMHQGLAQRITGGLRWMGEMLGQLLHNHLTRRYLLEMDSRMLADVGLSRTQARFEASRLMWDSRPAAQDPRQMVDMTAADRAHR